MKLNPFFLALVPDESDVGCSKLHRESSDSLRYFQNYVKNSIKSQKNKEVVCAWSPLEAAVYDLKPQGRLWKIVPETILTCDLGERGWYNINADDVGSTFGPNHEDRFEDPVYVDHQAGRTRITLKPDCFRVESSQIYLDGIDEASVISWCGDQFNVTPTAVSVTTGSKVCINGAEYKLSSVNANRIVVDGFVDPNDSLLIDKQPVRFTIEGKAAGTETQVGVKRRDNGYLQKTSANMPQLAGCSVIDVTAELLLDISVSKLLVNGTRLNEQEWNLVLKGETLELKGASGDKLPENCIVTCPDLCDMEFAVTATHKEEKWIQLDEIEQGDGIGRSALDPFFDNARALTIRDASAGKSGSIFRVVDSRSEERQLLLSQHRFNRNAKNVSCFPGTVDGKKRELSIDVDVSQLNRQKDALNNLQNRPPIHALPLLNLFRDRSEMTWPTFQPVAEQTINWRVLTDLNYEGCDKQREFVCKALATPDYAILDGPPGTGKTTVILELIYQVVSQGKRLLLTASTHAAINNVLERIAENEALSRTIFPLRVGDENKAGGVKQYQYDHLKQQLSTDIGSDVTSELDQLMVDSSNLICGTTIGILRLFREEGVTLDAGVAPFDMMIIDECSKTTFQEFLVPARYARRWILVGDVRQLSPFTDREQIEANLENLALEYGRKGEDDRLLPKSVQEACMLLELCRLNSDSQKAPYQTLVMVPVSSAVLASLSAEIDARSRCTPQDENSYSNILLVRDGPGAGERSRENCVSAIKLLQEPWLFYQFTVYFVADSVMEKLSAVLPRDVPILAPDWQRSRAGFEHRALLPKHRIAAKAGNDRISTNGELVTTLIRHRNEKSWAGEVCWRLERMYWLRMSGKSKTSYERVLSRLYPNTESIEGKINQVRNIAFPSVLEALGDAGLRQSRRQVTNTLNTGFRTDEKATRHVTLEYQHRMHPDISRFPREQIYANQSLRDGKVFESREWGCEFYKTRSTWLDVRGRVKENANLAEASEIAAQLRRLCDWKHQTRCAQVSSVAVLTFYKGQEKALRQKLQQLPGCARAYSLFSYKDVNIKLATVDYFQGQEADVVFLSMVNTGRDGFLDSPNRLNVAITRARYQLVVVGHFQYFSEKTRSIELKGLASACSISGNLLVDKVEVKK